MYFSLELQNVVDQEEATLSILVENERLSEVNRNSRSDLAPSGNTSLVVIRNSLYHVETHVEMFLIVELKL